MKGEAGVEEGGGEWYTGYLLIVLVPIRDIQCLTYIISSQAGGGQNAVKTVEQI
jgi:hypothetical protein